MSKHTTNGNRRKAGREMLALKADVSEISSSNVSERKLNTARNGMVLRSHSRSLQSPLKNRVLVGASIKEGIGSRRERSRRGVMAPLSAVIKSRSAAGDIRCNVTNPVFGSFDGEGVAFMLTQMIQTGRTMFENIRA